jgi:hypothetical protein
MMEKIGRESDKFMLRMPDGMRDRIKASAEDNKRSMNAEIIVGLSSDRHNFNLAGFPKEAQLRRIVEGSARQMFRELKIALDSPDADISDPPDLLPPFRNEE